MQVLHQPESQTAICVYDALRLTIQNRMWALQDCRQLEGPVEKDGSLSGDTAPVKLL